MQKALIVVDVQNDFCPGGALAVPKGDEVVEPANRLTAHAQKNNWFIYASGCQHPAETSHFNTSGGPWPPHCVKGTEGAKFHPGLAFLEKEFQYYKFTVLSKGTRKDEDAYSAFDGDYAGTKLYERLICCNPKSNCSVKRIYVLGLATDYCVKATVLEGLKHGFEVALVTDACRAVDVNPGDGEKALAEMKVAGAIFMTTEEVLHEE